MAPAGRPQRLPPVRLEKGTSGASRTDSLRDRRAAEEYFEQHGIRQAFSDITEELIVHRPGAPYEYMMAALAARADQQALRANDVLDTPLPAGEGVRLLRVRVESRSSSGKRAHQQLSSIVPERGPSLPRMLASTRRKVFQALDQTLASGETPKDALRPSEDEELRSTHEGAGGVGGLDEVELNSADGTSSDQCGDVRALRERVASLGSKSESKDAEVAGLHAQLSERAALRDLAPTARLQSTVRRLLRNKIAADPGAFFDEADDDDSEDLSFDEWVKTGQLLAQDADQASLQALFAEVAGGAVTIPRARFFEVAEEYRAVRHFVDKAECMGLLTDSLISWVFKERSRLSAQEEATCGSHQKLEGILSALCEEDVGVALQDVAGALRQQAEACKAQAAARARAPLSTETGDDAGAKEGKYANVPVSWLCSGCCAAGSSFSSACAVLVFATCAGGLLVSNSRIPT